MSAHTSTAPTTDAVPHRPAGGAAASASNVVDLFPTIASDPPTASEPPCPTGLAPNVLVPGAGREEGVRNLRPHRAHERVAFTGSLRDRWPRPGCEAGMATAEYAIATLAAVGFAGLLVVILRSDAVRGLLMGLIEQALSFG